VRFMPAGTRALQMCGFGALLNVPTGTARGDAGAPGGRAFGAFFICGDRH
jgi:hypothetical protein